MHRAVPDGQRAGGRVDGGDRAGDAHVVRRVRGEDANLRRGDALVRLQLAFDLEPLTDGQGRGADLCISALDHRRGGDSDGDRVDGEL